MLLIAKGNITSIINIKEKEKYLGLLNTSFYSTTNKCYNVFMNIRTVRKYPTISYFLTKHFTNNFQLCFTITGRNISIRYLWEQKSHFNQLCWSNTNTGIFFSNRLNTYIVALSQNSCFSLYEAVVINRKDDNPTNNKWQGGGECS